MKKFIKILVVIILVIGAVAGTCWFFYSRLIKDRNSYSAALNYSYSASKAEFEGVMAKANVTSESGKFSYFISANEKLNVINDILIPYLSKAENSEIDQNRIYTYLSRVKNKEAVLKGMFNEYIKKANNYEAFNKESGANPLYDDLCEYMVDCARYLSVVSDELDNLMDTSNDAKFYVIEIYLNIVVDTFSNIDTESKVHVIKNSQNLIKANACINFNHSYFGDFSSNSKLFMKNYSKCDTSTFVSDFAYLYETVNAIDGNSNNDTMFYLKKVLGV